jgi:flagellar biosynthesis/type III secretory pathway M-ring protein FliF/YscJ
VTVTILIAELVGANPGPAVHLAVLAVVLLAALAVYTVVRRRRRRDAAEADAQPPAHDPSSPTQPSKRSRP